jgi:hypothetical protein
MFYITLYVPCFIIAAAMASTVITALIRGHRFAFGYEGIIRAATVRILPARLPEWINPRVQVLQQPSYSGKKKNERVHSAYYTDPSILTEIIGWIHGSRKDTTQILDGGSNKNRTPHYLLQ